MTADGRGTERPSRRPLAALWRAVQARLNWCVAGLLLLLAVAFMSQGLPPGRVGAPMGQLVSFTPWQGYYPDVNPPFRGGDLLLQQLPWRHWMQQELAAGRFPLWASSPTGGMPVFASMQPAVLYPLHLLWILMPIGAGISIIMALKLWLAGLGMWFFLRALGLHPVASLLSALGLMFSAPMVNWVGWQHTGIYLLLPWMAWAVYAWLRNGKQPALFCLAVLVTLAILGGHPESLFMEGIVVPLWALWLLDFRDWRKLAKQVIGLAIAATVGVALGAIQLLPFLSVLELTHAEAVRTTSTAALHFDIQLAVNWLLPRYWGQFGEGVLSPNSNFIEESGYIGLVALFGLLLAFIGAVKRRLALRLALPWLVIGILAWIIAYDDTLGMLIRDLPGLNRSINVRWIFPVGFAVLVVSAFGWDWLARRSTEWIAHKQVERWPPGRLGGAAMALLAVGLGIMALHALGVVYPPTMREDGPWRVTNNDYRFYWAIWAAGVALALLGAAGLWTAAWRARWVGPLLLSVVLVLDLWRLLFTINGTAPADQYYPQTSFLQQVKALVPPTERILTEGDGMPTNTALIYGIRDWRVQDPMLSERAHRAALMLDPKLTESVWTDYNMILHKMRLPIAPMLGIRYFIFPVGVNPNTPSLTDPTVPAFTRLAYKDGLGLWRAEGVPGFAYLSDNVQTAADEQAAGQWMEALDWQQTRTYPALVEAPVAVVAGVKRDPAGSSPGRTEVLEYLPGYIRIQAEASRESLLVVSEGWYPGWRAALDGNPVGVLRTNYLSQGVVVPAGKHTVELSYAPGAFKYGKLLSGLGVLGLLALGAWTGWRKKRKKI